MKRWMIKINILKELSELKNLKPGELALLIELSIAKCLKDNPDIWIQKTDYEENQDTIEMKRYIAFKNENTLRILNSVNIQTRINFISFCVAQYTQNNEGILFLETLGQNLKTTSNPAEPKEKQFNEIPLKPEQPKPENKQPDPNQEAEAIALRKLNAQRIREMEGDFA
jgi:hypothetical protein